MVSRYQKVFCRIRGALRRTHVLKVSFVGTWALPNFKWPRVISPRYLRHLLCEGQGFPHSESMAAQF